MNFPISESHVITDFILSFYGSLYSKDLWETVTDSTLFLLLSKIKTESPSKQTVACLLPILKDLGS